MEQAGKQGSAQKGAGQQRPSGANMKTGIDPGDRAQLAKAVGKTMAETYVLYTKTQAIHWNVVGPMFYSLHKMTEEQYQDLADAIDELAERIRALGAPAPGSFAEFLELSDIKESRNVQTAEAAVEMLWTDHETAARTFREATRIANDLDDMVTSDLLAERMAQHEKYAWMLRATAQESGVRTTQHVMAQGAGGSPKPQ